MRSRMHRGIVLAMVALAMAAGASAAGRPAINISSGQLALRGYDPMAYWTAGAPRRGDARFEYRWSEAVWRFATAEHRDRFAADPARYAPQFGGYCAYAVSQGYTADADPTVWRIVDGRLYVNYSRRAARLWEQDLAGNIASGHRHWPDVLAR